MKHILALLLAGGLLLLVTACTADHGDMPREVVPQALGELQLDAMHAEDICFAAEFSLEDTGKAWTPGALQHANFSRATQSNYPNGRRFSIYDDWQAGPIPDGIIYGMSLKGRTLADGMQCGRTASGSGNISEALERELLRSNEVLWTFSEDDDVFLGLLPSRNVLVVLYTDF